MSDHRAPPVDGPVSYHLVVRGELADLIMPTFEGLIIHIRDGQTELLGELDDNAHLQRILERPLDTR
jgi:hypothetical protein